MAILPRWRLGLVNKRMLRLQGIGANVRVVILLPTKEAAPHEHEADARFSSCRPAEVPGMVVDQGLGCEEALFRSSRMMAMNSIHGGFGSGGSLDFLCSLVSSASRRCRMSS